MSLHKFLILLLAVVFHIQLMALQLDEERAMHLLFEIKHGLNRAVHAAAQQVDERLLAEGVLAIDEDRAKETALAYLRSNLRLDEQQVPRADSLLNASVEIVVFEVINRDQAFPYRYVNDAHDYEVTLYEPGVVLMIRVEYPRIYHLIDPIVWTIKGTAELYTL